MDRAAGQTNKRRLTVPRNRPSRTACGNLRLLPPGSKTKEKKGNRSSEEGHTGAMLLVGHGRKVALRIYSERDHMRRLDGRQATDRGLCAKIIFS